MKLKAAIISLGSKSSKMLAKAMEKYFDQVDMIDLKNTEVRVNTKEIIALYNGKEIQEYDHIFLKGSFRYSLILRTLADALKGKTYLHLNPETFTICNDKALTQIELEKHKVPSPKTYITATITAAKDILKEINYPVIMKIPEGTQGKGVLFADSFAGASSILDTLSKLNQPFIIQEYVETGGTDIRAIVAGDKVVASMQRKAAGEEKRANIHAGGKGKVLELDSHTKKISVRAAKSVGADVCAVDLLEGMKGPLVIEINVSPGLQGITETTGVDVAGRIARCVYKKTKDWKENQEAEKKGKAWKEMQLEEGEENEIATELVFRGKRVLLPELITRVADFEEGKEAHIKVKKNKVVIEQVENKK